MLDVNAGIPLVDEAELLAQMIHLLQEHTDIPLCIDSSVIEALEAGLDAYEGKALVNSVTGEDDRLELILPIVAKHGAAVIGLANDETGIPETAEQRLVIARKIVSVAGDHGIPPEDVRDRSARDDRSAPIRRPCASRCDAIADDPRRARREHVPGRVQRLVRAARAPHAQRRVPGHGARPTG